MFAKCPQNLWGGALYFISFVDDYSRKLWVYLLKSKDDAFVAFTKFHAFITTHTVRKLKCVGTNNGVSLQVLNLIDFVKILVLRGS